jgi:hypothetical protein
LLDSFNQVDFSWDNIAISYWTSVEINFAIICACVMTLKPLITKIAPNLIDEGLRPSDLEGDQRTASGGHPPTIGTKAVRIHHVGHSLVSEHSSIDEAEEQEIAAQFREKVPTDQPGPSSNPW